MILGMANNTISYTSSLDHKELFDIDLADKLTKSGSDMAFIGPVVCNIFKHQQYIDWLNCSG